ncbi:MAG: hypothetical protein R3C56_12130 [Pirellulaceae bacterium]
MALEAMKMETTINARAGR